MSLPVPVGELAPLQSTSVRTKLHLVSARGRQFDRVLCIPKSRNSHLRAGRQKVSSCPGAEIGFTVTSERDPGRFEHVKTYIFHVPYALIRLVHVDATIIRALKQARTEFKYPHYKGGLAKSSSASDTTGYMGRTSSELVE